MTSHQAIQRAVHRIKMRFVAHDHDWFKRQVVDPSDFNPLGTITWMCDECGITRRTPKTRGNPLTGRDPADYEEVAADG